MTGESKLKNYVCTVPFKYLELHRDSVYCCCPSWLPNKVGTIENLDKISESEELKKVQNSILDGSYKYCSKTQCPYLSELIIKGTLTKGFVKKEHFKYDDQKFLPTNLNFNFDRSCNLSCPSCRNFLIMADGKEIEIIDDTITKITELYGGSIKMLYLSGSADPFASKSFRKFLLNFDIEKFPNINHIHLHTNGLLLNEKMWKNLSHIHKYIKSIEISIDSATENTYNVLRRGGNWDTLIQNLKFIATTNIKNKNVSFVVQDTNYQEMEDFYILMSKIFNNQINIFYNKIVNWGTFTEGEYKIKKIWDDSHPEYILFVNELKKIINHSNVTHNMFDILEKEKLKSKILI